MSKLVWNVKRCLGDNFNAQTVAVSASANTFRSRLREESHKDSQCCEFSCVAVSGAIFLYGLARWHLVLRGHFGCLLASLAKPLNCHRVAQPLRSASQGCGDSG